VVCVVCNNNRSRNRNRKFVVVSAVSAVCVIDCCVLYEGGRRRP